MNREMLFEIRNIDFSYGKNKVVNNLSLTIEPGKFYGIVGPNGCGKTTFLDLVVRNREPQSGTIRYRGRDIRAYSGRKLARDISLVPQDFYIKFPFTVREVVLMGRHPYISRFASPSAEDLKIADDAMRKAGVDEFRDKYITELSGGEKQRVVFARALAQDTSVLILDEGTSNMDIRHTLNILDIVADGVKLKKRTVIAVMHNLHLAAAYCDNLIFMRSGRIASEGSVDEVLNEQNIKDVFEVDSRVYFDRYSNSRQVIFKRGRPDEGKNI